MGSLFYSAQCHPTGFRFRYTARGITTCECETSSLVTTFGTHSASHRRIGILRSWFWSYLTVNAGLARPATLIGSHRRLFNCHCAICSVNHSNLFVVPTTLSRSIRPVKSCLAYRCEWWSSHWEVGSLTTTLIRHNQLDHGSVAVSIEYIQHWLTGSGPGTTFARFHVQVCNFKLLKIGPFVCVLITHVTYCELDHNIVTIFHNHFTMWA